MLFNSWEFVIFLSIVLPTYYALSTRGQNWFLLFASYFFYSWWDWRFSSLLVISTVMDYYCARLIQKTKVRRRRRFFLAISMTGNLGILCAFKYYNFFVDSFVAVINQLGFQAHVPILQVVLPVGISFYTFQTMSYVIDVYRKQMKATEDLLLFALFVSYFPQLVAGPIERADRLMSQLQAPRTVTEKHISSGIVLLLIGFVKKLAIADTVAPSVDQVFTLLSEPNWHELVSAGSVLMAIFLFTLQIYGDFSGYSDMARGISRILGVQLMRNFDQPYLSQNISEFWKRWHISLSTWIRDYLYIPLGGNRGGLFSTCKNLLLTMTLAGLWHGANWTFVVWGALHGFYLVLYRLSQASQTLQTVFFYLLSPRWLRMVLTFTLVSFTWLFFRAQSLEVAGRALKAIADGGTLGISGWDYVKAFYFAAIILAIDIPGYLTKKHSFLIQIPPVARGIAMGSLIVLLLLKAPNASEIPFIYFQF